MEAWRVVGEAYPLLGGDINRTRAPTLIAIGGDVVDTARPLAVSL